MRKYLLGTALAVISIVGSAQANTINGSIWENVGAIAGDATIANKPASAPDVTFTVTDPISFDSRSSATGYTIGGFLATGGATPLTGIGELGNTLDNTYFFFTGNVTMTTGQTFTVTHDDGLQLLIGSTMVIDQPGGTAPTDTQYTWGGPSGTYAFELSYGEAFGPPGVLKTDLPLTAAVPEPSTWAMMILGFFGLGFMAYRRKNELTHSAA